MLKLLRRLRFTLVQSSSVKRYSLYAIGEILLVVIGILVALQINNWNEGRKDRLREREFLLGIQADLQKDSLRVIHAISQHEWALGIMETIKPGYMDRFVDEVIVGPTGETLPVLVNFDSRILSKKIDVNDRMAMGAYCMRLSAFRTSPGTFNSLIADGNSQLLTNRELFNKMQYLYLVQYENLNSIYESIKEAEYFLNQKHALLIQNNAYPVPGQINDEVFISDLLFFYQSKGLYCVVLNLYLDGLIEILEEIREELVQFN